MWISSQPQAHGLIEEVEWGKRHQKPHHAQHLQQSKTNLQSMRNAKTFLQNFAMPPLISSSYAKHWRPRTVHQAFFSGAPPFTVGTVASQACHHRMQCSFLRHTLPDFNLVFSCLCHATSQQFGMKRLQWTNFIFQNCSQTSDIPYAHRPALKTVLKFASHFLQPGLKVARRGKARERHVFFLFFPRAFFCRLIFSRSPAYIKGAGCAPGCAGASNFVFVLVCFLCCLFPRKHGEWFFRWIHGRYHHDSHCAES